VKHSNYRIATTQTPAAKNAPIPQTPTSPLLALLNPVAVEAALELALVPLSSAAASVAVSFTTVVCTLVPALPLTVLVKVNVAVLHPELLPSVQVNV
jgi:hypothetical protein